MAYLVACQAFPFPVTAFPCRVDRTYQVTACLVTSYRAAFPSEADHTCQAAAFPFPFLVVAYPSCPAIALAFPFQAAACPSYQVVAFPSFQAVRTSAAAASSVIASFAEESYQLDVE